MTRTELFQLARKFFYRQKLTEELPVLEARLTAYLEMNNVSKLKLGEYLIEKKGSGVVVTTEPKTDPNQLNLIPEYFCLQYEKKRL